MRNKTLLAVLTAAICVVSAGGAFAIDLSKYEKQIYSQEGEDGVIEKLFEIIKPTSRYAVEFGADDGIRGSNTRNLFLRHKWSGLLIEGDEKAAKEMERNYSKLPRVKTMQSWVWPGNFEILLEQAGAPKDMDFLSIDIDSNDYYVWKVLHDFRPKVVLIEFNASFAPPQRFVVNYHPYNYLADSSDYFGASIQSLYELGKKKGYELVYCDKNGINLFFVDKKYFPLLGIKDNSPVTIYRPPQYGLDKGGRAPNGRGHFPFDSYKKKRHFGLTEERFDQDTIIEDVRVKKIPRYDY